MEITEQVFIDGKFTLCRPYESPSPLGGAALVCAGPSEIVEESGKEYLVESRERIDPFLVVTRLKSLNNKICASLGETTPDWKGFEKELADLVNRFNIDTGSGQPDYRIAENITEILRANVNLVNTIRKGV